MKVLDAGHRYELASLDGNLAQTIQFVKREGPKFPGNIGSYSGTTSQEALRVALHRAQYVNAQEWSWQTWISLYLYGAIIWLYEHRAARRHHRSVPGWREAIWGRICAKCGHVGCVGGCKASAHEGEQK